MSIEKYVPETPAISIDPVLQEYLFRELMRIGDTFGNFGEGLSGYQPANPKLDELVALTLTTFGKGLLELIDIAEFRAYVDLVIGVDVQAFDPFLTSMSGISWVAGDLLFADGVDDAARLAKGTALQHLRMNAGATAPEWSSYPTLESLEGLTLAAGDILYATADNTLAKLAVGGTGKVLTVVGGVPVWVEPASKFVAAGVFSGTEEDIDLSTWIAQGFKRFKIMWSGFACATAGQALRMLISTNAGSSFVTTGYGAQILYATGNAPTVPNAAAGGSTAIQLGHGAGSGLLQHGFCEFYCGASVFEWFCNCKSLFATGPSHGMLIGAGHVGGACNALRIGPTSGSSESGVWSIHALRDF